jgi:hypothetical protein
VTTPACSDNNPLEALRDHAKNLGSEGRYTEAIAEWDRLIEAHTGSDEIGVADALAWKCWCLDRLGDGECFLAVVDQLVRYADSDDPWLRGTAGYGLASKASWLRRRRRMSEAITATDELLTWFERETDTSTRVRLGERLFGLAVDLSWLGLSRRERIIDTTLVFQPAVEKTAPVWRAVGDAVPMPEGARHSGPARLGRSLAETRTDRRARLEHALPVYAALVEGAAATAEPALERLGTRARINRAVTLMALGRWRTGKADFDVLFALGPEEFAEVIKSARARPDGDYEPTDVAIAIVANLSPDNEQHDRAFATKLLEQQSKQASSLIARLNARAALLTRKRD